jgi:hypothetical protein
MENKNEMIRVVDDREKATFRCGVRCEVKIGCHGWKALDVCAYRLGFLSGGHIQKLEDCS